MSNAGLTQLIQAITGDHIVGVLPRARAGRAAVRAGADVLGPADPQARSRAAVGVAIAIGLTGVATQGQTLPRRRRSAVAALVFVQLLVGTAFAFAIAAMFAALEVAGSFLDVDLGLLLRRPHQPADRQPRPRC